MSDQQFSLRWNNHQSTLVAVIDSLLQNELLVDCTLAAEGQYLRAHKVVLCACSPYFETLLSQHYEKHPIVILKDVKFQELKGMMDYMYKGEVNISQDQLGTFLKAAESLQIKGLTDGTNDDARGDISGALRQTARSDHGSRRVVQPTQQAPVRSPAVLPQHSSNLTIEPSTSSTRRSTAASVSLGRSREGSVSPTPRKRPRRQRRTSATSEDTEHYEDSSVHYQAQSTPVPSQFSPSSSLVITKPAPPDETEQPHPIEAPEFNRLADNVKGEMLPDAIVKSEYLEEQNEDDNVDLTLDDDDDLGDMGAGPSHSADNSNQGYSWPIGSDRSADEMFMSAQEMGSQREDNQGTSFADRRQRVAKNESRKNFGTKYGSVDRLKGKQSENNKDTDNVSSDNGKIILTRKTPHQLSCLLKRFKISPYISCREAEDLAVRLNLPVNSIKLWFTNRRFRTGITRKTGFFAKRSRIESTRKPSRLESTRKLNRFESTSNPDRIEFTRLGRIESTSKSGRIESASNPGRIESTSKSDRMESTSKPDRIESISKPDRKRSVGINSETESTSTSSRIRKTDLQRAVLENHFIKCQKPTRENIETLSIETDLPKKVIYEWFKNQRNKNSGNAGPDQIEKCEVLSESEHECTGEDTSKQRSDSRVFKTPYQRIILEESFKQSSTPSKEETEALAEKIHLSPAQVYSWFCVKRHKNKSGRTNKKPAGDHKLKDFLLKGGGQKEILEQEFLRNPYPSEKIIFTLSENLQLNATEIRNWFKNRRVMEKRKGNSQNDN